MLLFRKFFDTATTEPATQNQEPQSIAALMAHQGVVNRTHDMVAAPIMITETKEENKPVNEPTPAATATSPSDTASTTSETPTQTKVEEPVQQLPIATEQVNQPSWQEVLKSQQPETVLSELGYDDQTVQLLSKIKSFDPKVVGLIQAYEQGKHVDYLRELSTDYSKMSDEDVMRHQLRRDNPQASDKALEVMFKKEVVQIYNLDSEDPDELAEGKLYLEAKAARYRSSLIENQQNYLLPKAPEPQRPVEVDRSADEDVRKFEVYRTQFNDNPYTKDIFNSKSISFGEGDEKFSFKVDPNAIVKVLFNGEKWMERMSEVRDNPDGTRTFTPDTKKQFLVGMVAEYGEDFLKEYAKHFKSLGGKTVTDTIDNAKPPENTTSSTAPRGYNSVAEAMAKEGRPSYGG